MDPLIASAPLRAMCSIETMGPFDRICPVTLSDERLLGDGSRPTPSCCCAKCAIVKYWQCDALELRGEITAACR